MGSIKKNETDIFGFALRQKKKKKKGGSGDLEGRERQHGDKLQQSLDWGEVRQLEQGQEKVLVGNFPPHSSSVWV